MRRGRSSDDGGCAISALCRKRQEISGLAKKLKSPGADDGFHKSEHIQSTLHLVNEEQHSFTHRLGDVVGQNITATSRCSKLNDHLPDV